MSRRQLLSHRSLVAVIALLATGTLGGRALLGQARPLAQTTLVGALPDALVLDAQSDRAFVANDGDATVSVLDLTTGRVLRSVAVGDPSASAPLALALDARTHQLFAANRGDNGAPSVVRLLDSRSGAPLATIHVGPEATALAVDERRGHVFVTTEEDGSVSMLDARTGAVLHTTRVGLVPVALAVDPGTARAFVVHTNETPPEYGGTGGRVSVLNTRTGAVLRSVPVGRAPLAIAVDTGTARVFVASGSDDTVRVIDARTGAALRTVAVGLAPEAVAVDARRGRVFVVNAGDGTLSVLDARTGELLRTQAVFTGTTASLVTMPYAIAVDEAQDRVYVTAWGGLDQTGLPVGSGLLAVLDARSGRRLRTLAVGVAPQAVAVDAGNGRVVVVNSGGVVRAPQGWAERWMRQVAGRAPWLARLVPRGPATYRAPGSVSVIDARI